jgi:hypothetical protein
MSKKEDKEPKLEIPPPPKTPYELLDKDEQKELIKRLKKRHAPYNIKGIFGPGT